MMILPIVLVFALNMIGTHGHCRWYEAGCRWDKFWDRVLDNCYCVRTHQCYQEDISKQRICTNNFFNDVDPDYVCCRTPVRYTTVRPTAQISTKFTTERSSFLDPTKKPSQWPQPPTQGPPKTSTKIPEKARPSKPTTQVPSLTSTQIPIRNPPTQIQPSSSQSRPTDCTSTCMPLEDCHDEELKSNSQHKQGSCPNPSDVCCIGLVQPLTAPPPQRPKPSLIPTQGQTLGSSPRPQSTSPAQTSPSADKNCVCTPFYKCYDEETSSNLTGVVNDRFFTPITDERCSDPNDVCCYNLVKITATPIIDSSSEDCTGSCISIRDCPYHSNKLTEAQGGNADAVEELRRAVCSKTDDGALNVCCPPEVEGSDNAFSVKWPEN